ncbi:NAD kinase [Dysgonomonas sp. 25]|nr:NAD kinase [Dysgonomonas sp. 25]NDV70321.1 NAD kinase [Dysgonomonas sp. 25]
MKVAVFGSRNRKIDQIKIVFDELKKHDVKIAVQDKFYRHIMSLGLDYKVGEIIMNDDFAADMVISIGGDGTFLRTTAAIGKKDIPIFGINAGRLGFLADINENELAKAMEEVLTGKYTIEQRSLLQLSTSEKVFEGYNYALNEIAVLKQDTASMITVNAHIDDQFLNSYEADGLIIATPTGSTAYAMSVGGPIMTPTASNFILAAVAPHSLTARPLVVEDCSVVTLDIESRSGSFLISVDGRSNVLPADTRLTIKKADFTLKVIKRQGQTFYSTLRDKLMWGVDSRS